MKILHIPPYLFILLAAIRASVLLSGAVRSTRAVQAQIQAPAHNLVARSGPDRTVVCRNNTDFRNRLQLLYNRLYR